MLFGMMYLYTLVGSLNYISLLSYNVMVVDQKIV
jgi:hypothetical protein